jgi:hypothetical protein
MKSNEIRETMISAREEYIQLIKSELLGPGSEFDVPDAEHEIISSNPISRYSVGILYPQGNQVNQDNDETVPLEENGVETIDELAEVNKKNEEMSEAKSAKNHNYEYDDTADENLDEEISLSSQYMPSSIGITFFVRGKADVVRGCVSFASYRKATISDCVIPFEPDNPESYFVPQELAHIMVYDKESRVIRLISSVNKKEVRDIFEGETIPENESFIMKQISYRFAEYIRNGYVRVPHNSEFTLDFSKRDYLDDNKNLDSTTAKVTALRTRISDELWSLTIMLVNDIEEVPAKSHHCIFQPILKVSSEENGFVFIESDLKHETETMDYDELSLELLYRHRKAYSTGLGVSADWEIDDNGKGSIWTDFFPEAEVPSMDFELPKNDKVSSEKLSMKYLSDLDKNDKSQKIAALKNLVDLYKSWVDELEKISESLDIHYKSAAAKNILECKSAYVRMYSGIKTLQENDIAYNAFMLANRAMFMQRIHLGMQASTADTDRYPDDDHIASLLNSMNYRNADDSNCRWRPFQIAFLLMDINSIIDDTLPERDIVDLIWFPTGGGKTEAYLGLTAFTIFYRRLDCLKESGGTAVIMRYTLRLLAAQQFTRAATLICACEYIRNDCEAKYSLYPSYPLGKESITIGLWIGGTHIPNKNITKDYRNPGALECLKKLEEANAGSLQYIKEKYNKFQVLKCPWCGTKLVKDRKKKKLFGKWGYNMKDNKHFYMFCPQNECDFTIRLPIQIIDEELYEKPPTLLFGTVDKFAMLPWDGRIGSFFATDTENRTPELVIQDELHLISGALGTIVGLYETAVDAICSKKGIRPKIIASTATIRRAKEQCSVLYNREVVQFPAPGLNSDDSFFAREAKLSYDDGVFGRKYVGIMPFGKTKAMMEIRAMAALLQRIYMMKLPEEVKDKMWTLTTYFNSLKDLGKASTLVEDDVKDFIIRIKNRMFTLGRLIINADELTSRVTTTELNKTLDKLEKLEFSKKNIDNKLYASNILLATNMISVGIDVARLNVMLMVGQPKLTSEYIQASSRVGRSFPGVVFVQYDATKSRDRSHYERFRAYHESFYRFVEPTGATPFSKPARGRALHAVLASIIRQQTGMSEDKDAQNFDSEHFADIISDAMQFILDRVEGINSRADNGSNIDIYEIESEIYEFLADWQNKVDLSIESDTPLFFGRRFMVNPPGTNVKRLFKPYNSIGKDNSIETLTSMRNVDTPVKGELVIWEEQINDETNKKS